MDEDQSIVIRTFSIPCQKIDARLRPHSTGTRVAQRVKVGVLVLADVACFETLVSCGNKTLPYRPHIGLQHENTRPRLEVVRACRTRIGLGGLAMETPNDIDVLFVAGFGPIVRDPAASRKFYSVTSVPRWLFRYSLRQIRSRLVAREDCRAIAPCQSRTQPP